MLQRLKSSVEKAVYTIDNFAKVEQFTAALLVLIPYILKYVDKCPPIEGYRSSISAYVRMPNSYWFGSLVALAGAMFIFNGALHMKGKNPKNIAGLTSNPIDRVGRGYNLIFGVALFGVIYFDYILHCWPHHICAGIFFIGCALTMLLNKKRSWGYRIGMFLATILPLVIFFSIKLEGFTLLYAEWIGLFFIATHFIYQSVKNG